MSIHILGISAFYHDSAAALIRDGEIVAAAQEERFTRRKADSGFPVGAIRYCLEQGGLAAAGLDQVVFYEKPMSKFERLLETYLAFAPEGIESFQIAFPLWAKHRLRISREITQKLPGYSHKLLFVNHHESHAASAFFPSPFEEATILTLDAVGEWGTSSIGIGRKNRISLSHEMRFPHSLGMLYSAFTYYAGFKVNSGEYKLMGLAPYGEPRFVEAIRENIVDLKEDGSVWLDMTYFNYCQGLTMTSDKFHTLFGGPPRNPESVITQKEMDLAASVQAITEDAVLRSARFAYKLHGSRNLVMAGGVALNCVANGRVRREGPFENIWIQPAAGDAGGALGAALLVWYHKLQNTRHPKPLDSQRASFLGPSFTNDEISRFLDADGARYQYLDDEKLLIDKVASLLAQEKVVGWFHGSMEFGPRALGRRSILGDARSRAMQQKMNLKIKFRESFRPFAPSVLRECVDQIFEVPPGEDTPYMLFVAPVRQNLRVPLSAEDLARMKDPDLRIRVSIPRSTLPAITHVDYSARIQTVDEERHGRYYRLIRRFYELTGCPVIVNTSFNVRGEPIVNLPEDAYQCFLATDMDCLVLENYVLVKEDQVPALLDSGKRHRTNYISTFSLD